MKIGVIGCGAVGGYYGARLAQAGDEVHFLLRSDYEAVRRQGVRVRSPQGDFTIHPHCARRSEEIGVCDLVVIGLKTTANDQFAALLPRLVGPGTLIITLQNGLGNEEALARLFPPEQILGGLCFVCLNRTAPGVIHHIDHGLVIVGEYQRGPQPRTHDLAACFLRAGFPCSVTDNLARTHWEKLVWNIPFNGLGVAGAAGFDAVCAGHWSPGAGLGPCLTTDQLLAEDGWLNLLRELMLEVIGTARALGLSVPDAIAEKQIQRTRSMGPYRASTLIDFERGQPLELQSLFLEPLRQAQAVGKPTPRLEGLCRVLQQLDLARAATAKTVA